MLLLITWRVLCLFYLRILPQNFISEFFLPQNFHVKKRKGWVMFQNIINREPHKCNFQGRLWNNLWLKDWGGRVKDLGSHVINTFQVNLNSGLLSMNCNPDVLQWKTIPGLLLGILVEWLTSVKIFVLHSTPIHKLPAHFLIYECRIRIAS